MTSSIILGARLWPEAEVAEQRADGGGDERARQRRRPEGVGEAAPQHDGEEPSRNEGTAEREGRVMIAPSQNTRRSRQQGRSGLWWSPSGVRAGASLQYLALLKHGGGDTPAGERKRRTTLKSYLLQEAEAASRKAKIRSVV